MHPEVLVRIGAREFFGLPEIEPHQLVRLELEPGIDGLLHISDMSWTKKVTHPSEILSEGVEVEAVVLNVDRDKTRVSLGIGGPSGERTAVT